METEISKKAIVVDTNFIVELKDNFQEIVENLSKYHDVFVTEISINERLSQKYLEMQNIYKKIDESQNEFKRYATISIKKPFEEMFSTVKSFTKKAYNDFFGDKIIPFKSDNETMDEVLLRVFRKLPPFATAHGSSDKGFKDTLLWMSLIQYFIDHDNNNEVIFITNDKGFINNSLTLADEFFEKTKINIEIKTNDFYKTLLDEDIEHPHTEQITTKVLTDKEKRSIRSEITEVFNDICFSEYEDWNGIYTIKNFEIYEKIDASDVERCFDKLKEIIDQHIFSEYINPSDFFISCISGIEDKNMISIDKIERLYKLYKTIKTEYNDLSLQFYTTASEKINANYVKPMSNDDLPF